MHAYIKSADRQTDSAGDRQGWRQTALETDRQGWMRAGHELLSGEELRGANDSLCPSSSSHSHPHTAVLRQAHTYTDTHPRLHY